MPTLRDWLVICQRRVDVVCGGVSKGKEVGWRRGR